MKFKNEKNIKLEISLKKKKKTQALYDSNEMSWMLYENWLMFCNS